MRFCFCYNKHVLFGGVYMDELENLIFDNNFIDISYLLQELDLPVRLLNILKSKHFYSVDSFYQAVEELTQQYTSHSLFPNELVSFYPHVKERMARKDLICHLSGAYIRKGSFYYTYHPFIQNLVTGKVYTIQKKICTELAYIDYFPQDLLTYEEWYYRVHNAYCESDNGPIDFYLLSCECGEDCLDLYPLGKAKRKK